ncbi:hypothetical protein [Streptomyces sp. NBC_01500]|uniref:hypothetical protein n=1 Tax=Streptomyces sp. NBC_01500 TaxID=2903886 RepID=UPI00225A5763|nr:hypothetical protein [Streptomyces sp. NBC_01500]MCX4554589.1 hypothetical protein [Streptomyces sp. NBC_01500]
MRLSQTTAGEHLSWSQAAGTGQGFDWSSTLDRAVSGTPPWVLTVSAAALVLAWLGMVALAARTVWRAAERNRKRAAEERKAAVEAGQKPEGGRPSLPKRLYVMALASMSVSLYGMWGFARETAQLPEPFAVGFLAAFDLTELVLFTLLYKRADKGWTTQLRLMHNLAWCLVAVSATANFIHAPNAASAPFMAIMPVVAAVVIELEFRAVMKGAELPDTEEKPGPGKLLGLLWTKGWAALFAGLDIDPASKGGQVYRAALAKKAGKKLFRLRTLLETQAKNLTEGREAKRRRLAAEVKELQQARKAATTSMARADFAVDSNQALAVLRELGGWSEVDDVAVVDFKNPTEVTELMERVAIMPAAKQIEAAARAAEANQEADRAEAARVEAEAARERAEEEKRSAVEEKAAALAARQEAEEALAKAAEETKAAKAEAARAEDARERAEAARERAESEMTEDAQNVARLAERAEEEQKKLSEAAEELARVQDRIADETNRRNKAADEVTSLRDELQRLVNERESAKDTTRASTEEAQRAAGEVQRLQSALTKAQDAVREHTTAADRAADLRNQAEEKQRLAAEAAARTQAEAAEAQALLDSLRPQLADRLGGQAEAAALAAAPAFRSEAKQTGWELYLEAATAGQEPPTAAELARTCGVAEGNARNWIIDFKEKRAAMIANGGARRPEGETARSDARRAESSSARQEPSDSRADGHERAEDAAQTRPINGQRQPV